MKRHRRLEQLTDQVQARHGIDRPLTVFLVEADAEHPVGTRILWNGVAREIRYDPTLGPPPLPPGGPHMIIIGSEIDM